jgi:hypothetical protein
MPVFGPVRGFEVHPDALRVAAATMGQVAARTATTPERLLVGAHDTHAATLDRALDDFQVGAARAMEMLVGRAEALSALLTFAAAGFSGLEAALVAALSG